MRIKSLTIFVFLVVLGCAQVEPEYSGPQIPETLKWSERMAMSVMARNPDPIYLDFRTEPKWEYTFGLILTSIEKVGERTGDEKYEDYVEEYYDKMINDDGSIEKYDITNFNIDRVNPGKPLFKLYEKTGNEKYKIAMDQLRYHLEWQPRNKVNGFWHKNIYPWQMWLDGAYMGSPYYAQYALMNDEGDESFSDIAHQIITMEKNMRDPETGLLYHGWDESRTQRWADPETGLSPHFWGRAMGWYMMAIVDILDYFPEDHADRKELIAVLDRLSEALSNFQDEETGTWYQVVDLPEREGNYLEASATSMYVYAMAKGVNKGYLDEKYMQVAEKGYDGILDNFIVVHDNGLVDLTEVCEVAGLGGNPYRDASFEYYVNEPKRTNDIKGVGPFIQASLELGR